MTPDLKSDDTQPYAPEVLLGENAATSRLRLQIARIAPHFRIALLVGESGTGKRTVAQAMHRLSPAADAPLIALAADALAQLPRRPGTLYLTAVDTLDPNAQLAFRHSLRSLDRDTRVIVASRTDLKGMIATGRMRADLYDSIGDLEIRLASLRDRFDDLNLIAHAMLRRANPGARYHAETLARLRQHTWPENLSELHALTLKIARDGLIEQTHLPAFQPAAPAAARLKDVMHRHVMDVLESCSGNKLRAAELLGISRSTLYRMLESRLPALVG